MPLTIKEFIKLSEEEKRERYSELSDHDKFLWRVHYEPLVPKVVRKSVMTEEDKAEIERKYADIIKEFDEDAKK